jgi:hypothetical protein
VKIRIPALAALLYMWGAVWAAAQSAPPPRIVKDGAGKPNWVNQAGAAYDRNHYVAEVGYGSDPQRAEGSAFANLTGYFGQSVQSSFSAVESYKEQVSGGRLAVQSGVETEEAVARSSSMEQLIGARIGDRWYDERAKIHYAVAYLEKAQGIRLYGELLEANLRLIGETLAVPAGERESFEGVARYRLAAGIADVNGVFATVLSLLGGPNRRPELKSGEEYRREAAEIAKRIPVGVAVEGDPGGRIRTALASALAEAGFRVGGADSRYAIEGKLSLSPVALNNPNKFTRYVLEAPLVDRRGGTALFPYSASGREGHTTQSEADLRAVRGAEEKIRKEYPGALSEYLASLR